MGCGKSKHDVATGNILSQIKKPSLRSVVSSKSKKVESVGKTVAENDTKNIAQEKELKGGEGGESVTEKASDVKDKEVPAVVVAEEKLKPGALEAQKDPAKETDNKEDPPTENPKLGESVTVKASDLKDKEKAGALEANPSKETDHKNENAGPVVIAEEKNSVEEKTLVLQETQAEKEKVTEEPGNVREEKLIIKEEEGTVKAEEKAIKDDNVAVKKEVEAVKEDNLAVKKEVETAQTISVVDEAKPPSETGKEENAAIEKETKAD